MKIEIECVLKHETERAYLFKNEAGEAWVPKVLCEINHEPNLNGWNSVIICEKLATEKELI